MLAMRVVQSVEDRQGQLGFPHIVACLLPPEQVAHSDVDQIIRGDLFLRKHGAWWNEGGKNGKASANG